MLCIFMFRSCKDWPCSSESYLLLEISNVKLWERDASKLILIIMTSGVRCAKYSFILLHIYACTSNFKHLFVYNVTVILINTSNFNLY